MKRPLPAPSRRFRRDRAVVAALVGVALLVAGRAWLADHPQHDPWAPLDLDDPPGWATARKLASLRGDPQECRAVLQRSAVAFRALPPAGDGGACYRPDRTVMEAIPFSPDAPAMTCPVGIGAELWMRQGVQPAAHAIFGSEVAQVEHFGTYSCRRLYGREDGPWSEHATGNAIDIAGFVLADGTRISVLRDWEGEGEKALFLRRVRDSACDVYATTLSPDYNAAHADHLHLDQAARGFGSLCR